MVARICQSCGSELSGDARFCSACGKGVAVGLCQACGAKLIEGAHFCQKCGVSLSPLPTPKSSVLCPKCGKENLPTSKFCQKCGISLAPAASPQSGIKQKQYPEQRGHAITKGKEKARPRRFSVVSKVLAVIISVAILIIVAFIIQGQNPGEKTPGEETPVQPVISRDEAVGIATTKVEEDGVMSLDDRKVSAKEESNQWHITFPLTATMVRGGEPHVIIDKASGAIIEVYYTK